MDQKEEEQIAELRERLRKQKETGDTGMARDHGYQASSRKILRTQTAKRLSSKNFDNFQESRLGKFAIDVLRLVAGLILLVPPLAILIGGAFTIFQRGFLGPTNTIVLAIVAVFVGAILTGTIYLFLSIHDRLGNIQHLLAEMLERQKNVP